MKTQVERVMICSRTLSWYHITHVLVYMICLTMMKDNIIEIRCKVLMMGQLMVDKFQKLLGPGMEDWAETFATYMIIRRIHFPIRTE